MDSNDIQLAKHGDQQLLAKRLKENYSFLVKYVWKMSGDEQLAYDVTQETLVKAIQKISQYKGKSSFSSWLIQIATHTYLDIKRKQKRALTYEQSEAARLKREEMTGSMPAEWYDVQQALLQLDDQYRIPIVLKHYYGYDYEEIAQMTKAKTGTVKSRVHYGLKQLRKELGDHEG
ncbi:RNA polymerase sigma factor SigY [Halobacillus halophilus]|uniref:RNA polymerase sigma factor SigY n=1 Tax=Halobacillus halophilus TaxID=1570 RepID=UPI001CD3B1E8|nr:RNA polymerase sigma factor SigY [Halobacillus halophilus]MCA1010127.1 RNA polymerase sigma factor SigY [Halobacillus halophilus]